MMLTDERPFARPSGAVHRSQHQRTALLPADRVLPARKPRGHPAERSDSTGWHVPLQSHARHHQGIPALKQLSTLIHNDWSLLVSLVIKVMVMISDCTC